MAISKGIQHFRSDHYFTFELQDGPTDQRICFSGHRGLSFFRSMRFFGPAAARLRSRQFSPASPCDSAAVRPNGRRLCSRLLLLSLALVS